MKKIIKASASGATYAPIIGRDLDWFEGDVEKYVGKKAPALRKFLEDQDFVLDAMSGPARDSAWEAWRLDTEAGNIQVVFYFDLIPVKGSNRLNEGKITKVYIEDNQDAGAIRDEETRLFSSRKISRSKRRIIANDGELEGFYEDLAMQLGDAIQKLASDEDHLNNFVSYLSHSFPEWLRKYANTPEGMVSEFREFANMQF